MGKKDKRDKKCPQKTASEPQTATAAAIKKDVRNPDALRTRTSGSDAVREAKVQTHTKAVFKSWTHSGKPSRRLVCTELAPDQPGFIVVIQDFLDSVECERLCHAIDDVGLNMPNGADLNPRKNEAFLKRQSLSFLDPYLQSVIFERLEPYFPPIQHMGAERRAVGFDGSMRFYKYERGDQFGQHVDVSTRGVQPTEETEYTLLIYLNGGGEGASLDGGETIFWATKAKQLCVFQPQRGVALLHAHGRRCLMHEAAEVTRGVKYVLRSDVMYRTFEGDELAKHDQRLQQLRCSTTNVDEWGGVATAAPVAAREAALANATMKDLSRAIARALDMSDDPKSANLKPREIVGTAMHQLGLELPAIDAVADTTPLRRAAIAVALHLEIDL